MITVPAPNPDTANLWKSTIAAARTRLAELDAIARSGDRGLTDAELAERRELNRVVAITIVEYLIRKGVA